MYMYPYSTKPKPKEKQYIVPYISKNRWRIPGTGRIAPSEGEGITATTTLHEKTEEERQLDREAAEAVLRGEKCVTDMTNYFGVLWCTVLQMYKRLSYVALAQQMVEKVLLSLYFCRTSPPLWKGGRMMNWLMWSSGQNRLGSSERNSTCSFQPSSKMINFAPCTLCPNRCIFLMAVHV